MTDEQPWNTRLVYAMTGLSVPLPPSAEPALDEVIAWLGSHGWDHDALESHANALGDTDQPWPHPVPSAWLRDLGPARWLATLTDLRQRLGMDSSRRGPSGRTTLDADERRLVADRPPHHVG